MPSPPYDPLVAYLSHTIPFLTHKIEEFYSLADRDNKFVHFQLVPQFTALPPLPNEACIMTPQALPEPVVDRERLIPFNLPQKTSFFSSFFGGPASTNKAQTTASTEVAPQTSTAQAQPGVMMPVPPFAAPAASPAQGQPQPHVGAAPAPPFANAPPPGTAPVAYGAPTSPQFSQYAPPPAPAAATAYPGVAPGFGSGPVLVPHQVSTVPPGAVTSDEEYARQLQRQFDAEANRNLGLQVPPYNGYTGQPSAPPPPPPHT